MKTPSLINNKILLAHVIIIAILGLLAYFTKLLSVYLVVIYLYSIVSLVIMTIFFILAARAQADERDNYRGVALAFLLSTLLLWLVGFSACFVGMLAQ